ncbi:hypothetical protein LTR22_026643 [Elasticomyces elasticus]|nr:hypothetical protein LTR22_026643 [Elasticomyces elasticus]KAK4907942.1 hypothetical protein LTR49_023091 [Elasticomyces elasticus]KAK5748125.1 hypothetical protein LTS12_021817 [Elasticomyces elasticus]
MKRILNSSPLAVEKILSAADNITSFVVHDPVPSRTSHYDFDREMLRLPLVFAANAAVTGASTASAYIATATVTNIRPAGNDTSTRIKRSWKELRFVLAWCVSEECWSIVLDPEDAGHWRKPMRNRFEMLDLYKSASLARGINIGTTKRAEITTIYTQGVIFGQPISRTRTDWECDLLEDYFHNLMAYVSNNGLHLPSTDSPAIETKALLDSIYSEHPDDSNTKLAHQFQYRRLLGSDTTIDSPPAAFAKLEAMSRSKDVFEPLSRTQDGKPAPISPGPLMRGPQVLSSMAQKNADACEIDHGPAISDLAVKMDYTTEDRAHRSFIVIPISSILCDNTASKYVVAKDLTNNRYLAIMEREDAAEPVCESEEDLAEFWAGYVPSELATSDNEGDDNGGVGSRQGEDGIEKMDLLLLATGEGDGRGAHTCEMLGKEEHEDKSGTSDCERKSDSSSSIDGKQESDASVSAKEVETDASSVGGEFDERDKVDGGLNPYPNEKEEWIDVLVLTLQPDITNWIEALKSGEKVEMSNTPWFSPAFRAPSYQGKPSLPLTPTSITRHDASGPSAQRRTGGTRKSKVTR